MKAYLKAKKYLELYIVADNALVSFGIFILCLISSRVSQLVFLGSYKGCEVSAGKWDF